MSFSKIFYIVLCVGVLAGCGVKTKIEDLSGPKKVVAPNSNPNSIKVSGGAAQLQGSNVALEYSIGFKDRELEGANVDATISISTSRPQ